MRAPKICRILGPSPRGSVVDLKGRMHKAGSRATLREPHSHWLHTHLRRTKHAFIGLLEV